MLFLLALSTPVTSAESFTSDDVHAAAAGAKHSATVTRIFRTEIGGVGYNPYAPHSDSRVVGPGGLCSCGSLGELTRRGFTDPYDPYQVAAYIDQVLDEGRAHNWPYLR